MDTSHFSQTLIRGLTDKIYDRRKAAALEIEKLVRDNESAPERITEIIDALVQDFVYSNNSNARYGGLIGLAATAIALGPHVAGFLDSIVPPILSCFSNQDQKVRYYACESMYNIAKVAKGEVLRFFNSVFDALCKLSADSENTVKSGAELLDRLIKDVVSELSTTYVSPYQQPLNPLDDTEPGPQQELMTPASLPRNTAFSLPRFIPLLSQRIYVRNSNARQYLVSWIAVLDSIPDLELVSFLPEFLDGLIQCLSDPSVDVRTATKSQLADFLQEIRQASAAAAELKYIKERAESQQRQSLPPAPPSDYQHSSLDTSKEQHQLDHDELTQRDESSTLHENDASTTTSTKNVVVAENDGQGKGTYIPGQGIVVQYARIVEILVPHLSSPEEDIQRTALEWINEFTKIAQDVIIQFTPEIIKAVLPSLAHHVPVIHDFAEATNESLKKLVLEAPVKTTTSATTSTKEPASTTAMTPTPPSASSIGPNDVLDPNVPLAPTATSLAAVTQQLNEPQQQYHHHQQQSRRSNITSPTSMTIFDHDHSLAPVETGAPDPFDYQATLANLRLQFLNEHEETRVASLEWLLMLHKKAPHKILVSDDGTFPALLKTLSDSSEEVVKRDLQLLAQISSYSDHEYFRHFMTNLLLLFSTDRRLLESRGSLIIRQLCLSLDPERIYCTIADILETDEDLEFASIMVQNLNIILITAGELSDLRKRLRNLDHKDGQRLFIALYKSWCHNAVATLSLCLLAQAYEHASNMLQVFAELEITVNMLIQIDKLVQLLESPVFTYLRLQLLEPERYPHLFKCLYGILMLLPQSSAFSTLRNRLSSVSSLGFLNVMPKIKGACIDITGFVALFFFFFFCAPTSRPTGTESTPKRTSMKTGSKNDDGSTIKFQELLQHFKLVQSRHERQRRQCKYGGRDG
ncbi:vacuolar protein 14 C-terminal Fig4p binding-domain-containing protein [Absidia repens]|uniref:Vacuolar protein 14 C-terminal Fig4p binding-domain-containing protein n=1 Tax=Absidia repens TaxID=90262 RepID=A0A1X2I7R9_9FUNG|nr:vacuolar protein 14 C-terminal Fig4p binding-domain-containing protein [Absidia repens]